MCFLVIAGYADSILGFRGSLLDALLSSGCVVHVAAPDLSANSTIRQQLEARGIRVHDIQLKRTGVNPLFDFLSFLQLCFLMRRIKADYVLGYTVKPVIYGTLAAWITQVPHRFALITGLGYAFQGEKGQRRYLRRLVQFLYRTALGRADKVFFQNPDDEALFYQLDILAQTPRRSVVVNGSGIDLNSFQPASHPTALSFLLIARLLRDKGVIEYVAAARHLKLKFPETRFGLVGWIDKNPNSILQSELDSWIGDQTIEFYGKLEDVRPAISECSVFVLPSYREGTPRTVLEAMAMGRAIITTDAPGCRETVVDGDNGFLVPVKDVNALADAMIKFTESPRLVEIMGKRSREIAEEKYDVHKVNDVMLWEMGIK